MNTLELVLIVLVLAIPSYYISGFVFTALKKEALNQMNLRKEKAYEERVKKQGYPVYITAEDKMHFVAPMEGAYEVRRTKRCDNCHTWIKPHYQEPFASCECYTQEWYL